MPSKLVFTAAVVAGGLLVGGIGAASNAHPAPNAPAGATSSAAKGRAPLALPVQPAVVAPTPAKPTITHPTVAADVTPYDSYAHPLVYTDYPNSGTTLQLDGATLEKHEPTVFNPGSGLVAVSSTWMKWKAAHSGSLTITNDRASTVPYFGFGVFTGSTMATAHRIAWISSEGATNDDVTLESIPITKGVTYHFQVAGLGPRGSTPPTGYVVLVLLGKYTPPANDDKANAIGESGSAWKSSADAQGATLESLWEPHQVRGSSGYARTDSIWWKWTATSDGTIDSTLDSTKLADTLSYLSVFEQNDSHQLTELQYADNYPLRAPVAITGLSVRAGWTYYFAAGTLAEPSSGTFTLTTHAHYRGPAVTSVSPASGKLAGGTRVTLTGLRLTNATAVYFGQETGTNLHIVSDSKLVVTVPPGLAKGPVTVVVMVASGQTSSTLTGTRYFTYK